MDNRARTAEKKVKPMIEIPKTFQYISGVEIFLFSLLLLSSKFRVHSFNFRLRTDNQNLHFDLV